MTPRTLTPKRRRTAQAVKMKALFDTLYDEDETSSASLVQKDSKILLSPIRFTKKAEIEAITPLVLGAAPPTVFKAGDISTNDMPDTPVSRCSTIVELPHSNLSEVSTMVSDAEGSPVLGSLILDPPVLLEGSENDYETFLSATEDIEATSEEEKDDVPELNIRTEWIGTSEFKIKDGVEVQVNGELDGIISIRQNCTHRRNSAPYDPSSYISLAQVDNKLGFCDLAAANAHKALLLIECGLSNSNISYEAIPDLHTKIQRAMMYGFAVVLPASIDDELGKLRIHAYYELLLALEGCGSFEEGLLVAQRAIALYPDDTDLGIQSKQLKGRWQQRYTDLIEAGCSTLELKILLNKGSIYQKLYPGLDKKLHFRIPDLVRRVNASLKEKGTCEVRPVVFGAPMEIATGASKVTPEDEDAGPLGLFALHDIKEGELIITDTTLLQISSTPSSELQYCDSCNSCLNPPYLHAREVVWPECCDRVAFCSRACCERATNPGCYHTLTCKKDLDWLYKDIRDVEFEDMSQYTASHFKPILFTRTATIVVADMRKHQGISKNTHPLQHHLLARMTGNYPPPGQIEPEVLYDWSYADNVVTTTKFLLELGVDIFKGCDWDQEVIQTCIWRLDNNANKGETDLYPDVEIPPSTALPTPPLRLTKLHPSGPNPALSKPRKVAARITSLNINPNYLFMNHSCIPNVDWHPSILAPGVDLSMLDDTKDGRLRPGNSSVSCLAARDIKKGEQLKINYVGGPGLDRKEKRQRLLKWFPGGCGCELCTEENAQCSTAEKEKDVGSIAVIEQILKSKGRARGNGKDKTKFDERAAGAATDQA